MTHLTKSALYHPSESLWGHVGLSLPGRTNTFWFPIDKHRHTHILSQLDDIRNGSWLCFSTLNNRGVRASLTSINSIKFLNDDSDYPAHDWDLSWDGYHGFTSHFYKALESAFLASPTQLPKDIDEELSAVISERGLTYDRWLVETHSSHFYYKNGTIEVMELAESSLRVLNSRSVTDVDNDPYMSLECTHPEGMQMHLFTPQVQMVDFPLYLSDENAFLH